MRTGESIIDEQVIELSKELVTLITDELLDRLIKEDQRYIDIGVGDSYSRYTDFYLDISNSIMGYECTNGFDEDLINDFKERVFLRLNQELLDKVLGDPSLKGVLKIIMDSVGKAIKKHGES